MEQSSITGPLWLSSPGGHGSDNEPYSEFHGKLEAVFFGLLVSSFQLSAGHWSMEDSMISRCQRPAMDYPRSLVPRSL